MVTFSIGESVNRFIYSAQEPRLQRRPQCHSHKIILTYANIKQKFMLIIIEKK